MNEIRVFETIFEIIPFGVTVVDIDTFELIYLNELAKKMFDAETGQLCYSAIKKTMSPCPDCRRAMLIDKNSKPNDIRETYEVFNEVDDRWYQCHSKTISWPDGRIVMYNLFVDITNLKETQNSLAEAHAMLAIKNKELEAIAATDRLTGLYNRLKLDSVFNSSLRYCKRYNRPLSAILLDIDRFKSINDTFGHQVGDIALKELSSILSKNLRQTDTVGRWGGEEFLIICPETDSDQATLTAEKLRKVIEQHNFPTVQHITCSFGISQHHTNDTEDDIIKRADEALYAAKRNGRNRVEVS